MRRMIENCLSGTCIQLKRWGWRDFELLSAVFMMPMDKCIQNQRHHHIKAYWPRVECLNRWLLASRVSCCQKISFPLTTTTFRKITDEDFFSRLLSGFILVVCIKKINKMQSGDLKMALCRFPKPTKQFFLITKTVLTDYMRISWFWMLNC